MSKAKRNGIFDYCRIRHENEPEKEDGYEGVAARKIIVESTKPTFFAEKGPAYLLQFANALDGNNGYENAVYVVAVDLQANEVYVGLSLCDSVLPYKSYYVDFKIVSAMVSGVCPYGTMVRVVDDLADDLFCRVRVNEELDGKDTDQLVLFVAEAKAGEARKTLLSAIEYCNAQMENWADKLLLAGRAIIDGATSDKKEVEKMVDIAFNVL